MENEKSSEDLKYFMSLIDDLMKCILKNAEKNNIKFVDADIVISAIVFTALDFAKFADVNMEEYKVKIIQAIDHIEKNWKQNNEY